MKATPSQARYLFILAIAALLISCGSGADDSAVTDAPDIENQTTIETEPAETGRGAVKDALPEKDWEGREFRSTACDYLADDLIVEEETGARSFCLPRNPGALSIRPFSIRH